MIPSGSGRIFGGLEGSQLNVLVGVAGTLTFLKPPKNVFVLRFDLDDL